LKKSNKNRTSLSAADVQMLRGYVEDLNNIRFSVNAQRARFIELAQYDETRNVRDGIVHMDSIDDRLFQTVGDIVDLIVTLNKVLPQENTSVMAKLREAVGV